MEQRTKKTKKNAVLRARVGLDLKVAFESIAEKLRRKPSDLLRIVIEDYCDQKEGVMRPTVVFDTSPYQLNEPKKRRS